MKPSLLTRLSLSFFLSIVAFSPLAADEGKAPPPQHLKPATKELIEQLKTGGHVLIVRHERTNAFIPDTKEVDLNNCATQRNLSIAGHANAVENYRALSFLQIPIGQVYASPPVAHWKQPGSCLDVSKHTTHFIGMAKVQSNLVLI